MRRRRGPGLVGTMARTAVVAGTATAVVGGVQRRQAGKAMQQQEAAQYGAMQQQAAMQQAAAEAVAAQQAAAAPAPTAPPTAAAPAAQDDTMAQLEKLAQMHEQGVLTDDEFTAMKVKLLGV